MPLLALNAVKAHAVSDDGGQVAVAFATKDGGELSVLMPADCLDAIISALNRAKSAVRNKQATSANQISVTTPKTWLVTADLEVHGLVLLIFDPKTETQIGYALDAESSKKMAAGLIKNADAVLARKPTRRS